MSISIEIVDSLKHVNAESWDAISDGSPFTNHKFLNTLENTNCVGSNTGWHPYHLIVKNNDELVGAMPLYLKTHSYGEYVFDWAWADAYQQNGLAYYPKLVSAIPFSPITGARLFSDNPEITTLMIETIQNQFQALKLSSVHILFPDDSNTQALKKTDWLERTGVQFRWENEGFTDFEHFLSQLSHNKRKKIRQERKKVIKSDITCTQLTSDKIKPEHWDFFYKCYENTYLEHNSSPYLNQDFFHALGKAMAENILLIIAYQEDKPIAAALNLFGTDKQGVTSLYGRYWGAMSFISGLHFELCYYQAQEFCIQQGIQYFEGGAQGEHKLARGFKPRTTYSFHKIAHPEFSNAIADFVNKEGRHITHYQHELEKRAPFKKTKA